MKLVALVIVLGGLAVAAAWVPLQGRTLWQRAEQRGLPAAAADAVGFAARTAGTAVAGVYRWARSSAPSTHSTPSTPWRTAARRAGEPKAAPAPQVPAQPGAGSRAPVARKLAVAPAPAALPTAAPAQAAAAPVAEAGRDGIVPAAAPERLTGSDRAALDQLVSRARSGGR